MSKYPGIPAAVDGSTAVVEVETAASEGAGAYPITPSTQMGEGWALAVAKGATNVNGRKLVFFEPEGEHAAAAVTAGMSMMGMRATNFSSGQGIAYMHESLYAAVGKRLTYVLNVAARAMTKHALNVHAGHDDYHCVDDTGFFQMFAKNAQEAADLTLIAHRIAELALNPGLVAQDGFLTSHVIESVQLPERALVKEFLGDPSDHIESPTPAQKLVFGPERRRIPELFDLDYPAMLGVVQNQDAYQQGVAAQRPFYFDHVLELADRAFKEFAELSGRSYGRIQTYRVDDADYVIVGQGSVVWNAEAVCDHLRATRKLKVGVLNLTMWRPFPADLITRALAGKKAVIVLERVDQPLAVDAPLCRELRAAMTKALENQKSKDAHPGLAAVKPADLPEFYSGCFGLGSRDLQPGDIVAAVDNVLPQGKKRRQFYLGIDFLRPATHFPKLQIWQEQLAEHYPRLAELSLATAGDLDLLPKGSLALRIHSVGGWGAITMGKNVALTAADLFGLHIKANPKYGSEKKGQPTTFYAVLAREPVRLNCELRHVDVVLSPDPNVFRHSNPLEGLRQGGVFVIQSERTPEETWASFPAAARRAIKSRDLRVFMVDAFKIASSEASDAELRYRMQGAAFMGAFFRVTKLMGEHGITEDRLFAGIRDQVAKKFGHLGEQVTQDNLRVIRRGFDETQEVKPGDLEAADAAVGEVPARPAILDGTDAEPGMGHPGRFWEQVCALYKSGQDGIADPFAAMSAIPAATSAIRDMTQVRFEVPDFIAANCTGCAQCWTQCPDAAIPGVVSDIDAVILAAIRVNENGRSLERVRQIVKHLAAEARRLLQEVPFTTFADILTHAGKNVVASLKLNDERRQGVESELKLVCEALADFPLAKTAPFFDVPEGKLKGSGGLLSITVNPDACKGCNLCVEVCPDGALATVRQDETITARLRRNFKLWELLPETPDRYVNVASMKEGIGVLSSLLLKQSNYRSMVGGDGACMGCGEKTVMHLVVSSINALMLPRVAAHLSELDALIARLDEKARKLLAADVDLEAITRGEAAVDLPPAKGETVRRIAGMLHDLKDLAWRYREGPSGKGRATTGIANATGCSSVWGSTYPYNPYPVPWVNHLFQDAPSVAIGLFEGNMRKMAQGFAAVRRAKLELEGAYDAKVHEPELAQLDWRGFSDDEMALCPPILAVGGDGAMLDIGFQNLSRLLASGKPIRVVVLDTQVYSNTGGQACTSGFVGQISDMAAWGKAQHGKEETRKELALIAMAHRKVFVAQSSQASPAHLIGSVLRGLQSRHPAVMVLHSPCPPEHGIGDDQAATAAKLALESRAYPILTYDPAAGAALSDRLSLDGNPSLNDEWPAYEVTYLGLGGEEKRELPVTVADWAVSEARFRKHFQEVPDDADGFDLVPFHEFLALNAEARADKRPFIHVLRKDRRLGRLVASPEIVALAEDRLSLWHELKEMAGLRLTDAMRATVRQELEGEVAQQLDALRAEYEAKLKSLPVETARRLAQGLIRAADGQTLTDLISRIQAMTDLPALQSFGGSTGVAPKSNIVVEAKGKAAPAAEAGLGLDPYIDTARCTSCDECTNLNRRMFAYNEKKQAYIKDARAGSFRELVMAAEKCPVQIIHPGTPINSAEKDLEKWRKRAERFA